MCLWSCGGIEDFMPNNITLSGMNGAVLDLLDFVNKVNTLNDLNVSICNISFIFNRK